MTAPDLSPTDIQREVERVFQRPHRAFMTALYGHGDATTFSVVGRRWRVIPTSCEMQMRAEMPTPGDEDGYGRVFLVDWAESPLPLDLACRLAAGRVYQVSRDSRLAGLFGARRTEPGLMGSGLASVLLSGEITGIKKVSGILLTRNDAFRHFLSAWAGFPLGDPMTAASLVSWCLDSKSGATLIKKGIDSSEWRLLGQELREFVEHEAGKSAAMVWASFEQSSVRRFVQVAVLVEAHNRRQDAVAEGLLQGRVGDLGPGFGAELLRSRGRLSLNELIGDIVKDLDPAQAQSILQEADALIPIESFAATRAMSPWLTSGHIAREDALAEALQVLVGKPKWEILNRVIAALNNLKKHAMDAVIRTEEQRETRQMAVRLAAYLVKRELEPPPGPGTVYQRTVDLANEYAAEGGFVDWCRGRLRGPLPFHEALNQAIHKVLRAADKLRNADNKEFAGALIEWHAAGKPSNQVLPIENATRQLIADMVRGHQGRKVLVIMMDGMSWAVTMQLLHRLEEEQWAPILWRPKGFHARTHLPAVLAGLPTLTNVSRAAFFSGRASAKDAHKSTQEDARRWSMNKALINANDEAALPELILRNQLMDGESLRPEVRKAVDSDHAVVGVVVNAVDEELKGSSQVMRDFSTTVIKPLNGLINAAAGAERIVVLASDHGHVIGDAMKPHGRALAGDAPSGKRWRTLREDDVVYPFELELPAAAWRPKGSTRIAAIWDETVCHSQPAYGEHGGLSLAEVVAPVVLLAPEWLARLKVEEGSDLETRPFPIPGWWDLEVPPPRIGKTGEVMIVEVENDTQPLLPMPGLEPVIKVEPEQKREDLPLVKALRKSKAFLANREGRSDKDIETVLEGLNVILRAGDSMSDKEFARRCQIRPHRVGGLVARMGTILNIDGYAMVEYDPAGHQVKLNRTRLTAQYGLQG